MLPAARRPLAGLIVATALAGCTPPAVPPVADSCQLGIAAAVPLHIADNGDRLVLPIKLDGQPLTMFLDTGAEITLLSDTAERKASRNIATGSHIAGGQLDDNTIVSGFGGVHAAALTQIQRIDIGRLHGSLPAMVTDEHFTSEGKPVDGVIGMDLLGGFEMDLNLPGSELRLYRLTGHCATPAIALAQPLYSVAEIESQDRPAEAHINVTIDGQTLRAMIDTGSPNTSILKTAAERLGLTGAAIAGDKRVQLSGVGSFHPTAYVHRLDAIQIGPLKFKNVTVALDQENMPDVDVILGIDFARKVHLWFSGATHSIIMQYPPQPSPPLPPGS